MTQEEKAKEIGQKWYFDNMQSNEAAYKGALMMSEWKDQQFAEEKKQLVEKAIQWLKKNAVFTHPRKGTKECIINLARFKDAMKKE